MAFTDDLRSIINANSMENGSNTPDWVLRDFLCDCLDAWNTATNARQDWYGPKLTDDERQAIADAIDVFAESAIHIDNDADRRRAETLRGLLRRLA